MRRFHRLAPLFAVAPFFAPQAAVAQVAVRTAAPPAVISGAAVAGALAAPATLAFPTAPALAPVNAQAAPIVGLSLAADPVAASRLAERSPQAAASLKAVVGEIAKTGSPDKSGGALKVPAFLDRFWYGGKARSATPDPVVRLTFNAGNGTIRLTRGSGRVKTMKAEKAVEKLEENGREFRTTTGTHSVRRERPSGKASASAAFLAYVLAGPLGALIAMNAPNKEVSWRSEPFTRVDQMVAFNARLRDGSRLSAALTMEEYRQLADWVSHGAEKRRQKRLETAIGILLGGFFLFLLIGSIAQG